MPQATHLEQLALPLFGVLTHAEREMLGKVTVGRVAHCESSDRGDDPLNNPAGSDYWVEERHIRAELLRWLCIDEAAKKFVDLRGIRVNGSCIDGELDLSMLIIPFPLELSRCRLMGACKLNLTEIPRVDLTGSWVQSISAEYALVKGSFLLKSVVCVGHEVKLKGARIGGDLNCDGGRFEHPAQKDVPESGIALNVQAAKVGGAVLLRERFYAQGMVRLFSAQIDGNLECSGGTFENPAQLNVKRSGVALSMEAAKLVGAVHLRTGFLAKGLVNLDYATVGGQLDCDGGTFENAAQYDMPQTGVALSGQAIKVAGPVLLRSSIPDKGSFSAKGTVRLYRAQIGGTLECDGSRFENPPQSNLKVSGIALNLEGAKVAGAVFMRGQFHATGRVHLYNAQIGGDLRCDGGTFENSAQKDIERSGTALDAGSTRIGASVFLRADPGSKAIFSAKGAVLFHRAQIDGNLDCEGGKFENPAQIGVESSGVALGANGAGIAGDVLLRKLFSAKGVVDLSNTRIGRNFNCDGGTFENPAQEGITSSGTAVNLFASTVGGGAFLRSGVRGRGDFSAKGAVIFNRAQIEGNLECDGSKFENPAQIGIENSGVALDASGASVAGDILLRKSFFAIGLANLYHARIGGNLDCDGGTFDNAARKGMPSTGTALQLGAIRIAGGAFLRSGIRGRGDFSAKGAVIFNRAQIEGNLECDGSKFENPADASVEGTGIALQAYSTSVTGDVRLRRSFSAKGQVILNNARIGGNLDCDGGTLENEAKKGNQASGTALDVGSGRIAGSVYLRSNIPGKSGFSAKGIVSFYGAQIEGNLECDGSKFENPSQEWVARSGLAFQAYMARVTGDVRLRRNFSADGLVQLYGAKIGGSLDCAMGNFKNEGVGLFEGRGTALNAMNLNVAGDVLLNRGFEAKNAVILRKARIGGRLESNGGSFCSLDLGDAAASAIVDGVDEEEWHCSMSTLDLDGFTYERISREPVDDPLEGYIEFISLSEVLANIPNRLRWLELQEKFTRQPYLQLAKVLKEAGNNRGFRRVCMRMEERARDGQSWWRRLGGHLLSWTIGYGYASQRAVYWVLGLILLGTIVYWHGFPTMVPTQKDAYNELQCNKDTPAYYGRFHAFGYSFESSFPLVKLGIQEKWGPRESTAKDKPRPVDWIQWIDWRTASPGFLRYFRLVQVCIGWILTTLFAVGVSGVIRKD